MVAHKLTLLGHPARKNVQNYLLKNHQFHGSTRRLACADGVVAISGRPGIHLAEELFDVDLNAAHLLARFNVMLKGHGYSQTLGRSADLCAEAHLWMTLVGRHSRSVQKGEPARHLHPHPRNLHVWVYEIDSHNRPKEDAPCPNCRQWVRGEFLSLNGTSKTIGGF